MSLLRKISDGLYKRQTLVEMVAIFLFFSIVAVRFNGKGVQLLWKDYPYIALLLAFVTMLAVLVWLKIQQRKTSRAISEIRVTSQEQPASLNDKLSLLSRRQAEVFELIASGKSNKEILSILNIEQSTLKTHINQIYRILDIRSRREAIRLGRQQ